jgi:hypothetical protein
MIYAVERDGTKVKTIRENRLNSTESSTQEKIIKPSINKEKVITEEFKENRQDILEQKEN